MTDVDVAGSTLAQEGGADAAVSVRKHYDAIAREWSLPRAGELWDGVALAHRMGRLGEGRVVAIVDDGFDMCVPALAEHGLVWPSRRRGTTTHGTVVALLVLAVAPRARLRLYPASSDGHYDLALVEAAIAHATASDATVINLSIGQAFPMADVLDHEAFFGNLPAWPGLSSADLPFWVSEGLGRLDGWRALVRTPASPLGAAARTAVEAGRVVIAASGNAGGYAYSPAVEDGVTAVSFQRVERAARDGLSEDARATPPSFSQSELSDLAVAQPAGVLGSSFATPLIAGLVALMSDPAEMPAFTGTARLAALAAGLMVHLEHGAAWSPRRDGVVDELFKRAIDRAPHPHLDPTHRAPCPECAVLVADAYINFGLFRLGWNDLDSAENLLSAAVAVAPTNPHAAANLGVVHARRAEALRDDGDLAGARERLLRAGALEARAYELRPDHEPYRRRAAELTAAAEDPSHWQMAP
ncbi:S8 family serine peptidase [Georgenia sp. MJ206]|uniref:S8 family serine peptidase n=1 Tax=Georgenia wangjunii TaxID=3117730 RepID=UPI002F263CDD